MIASKPLEYVDWPDDIEFPFICTICGDYLYEIEDSDDEEEVGLFFCLSCNCDCRYWDMMDEGDPPIRPCYHHAPFFCTFAIPWASTSVSVHAYQVKWTVLPVVYAGSKCTW